MNARLHSRAFWLLLVLCFFSFSSIFGQSTRVKKVVLQGFWWNFKNDNFSNRWSNYLTELTPRLKAIGIDAVWLPPSYKNSFTGSVGYSPFDHYDLGDKYQKGGADSITVRTRMGNKDELLRMIAVLHANGMEAIQDIVLNHVDGAGSNTGTGGQDPEATYSMANANGYKNLRYVSYSTPMLDESQNDYWTRNGRWPKNYPNFYPNLNNNCTTGDICTPYFGPDISFESSAYGQSSNIPTTGTVSVSGVTRAYVNPSQSSNHMRNNARNWIMWLKKQTGVDGWRWDAVKHFPIYVQEDLIYNTKYVLPSFAQGGEAMMCIGEWIGNKTELDNYVTAVRSGSEEHTGTFDFSLRGYGPNGGLYSMVLSTGSYNMQNIPGEQQTKRYYNYASQRVHRTCPFVNSHDTYRPKLDANGNFLKSLGDATGWNTGDELGGNGQHIDPREPRLYSAYAVIFAMDGNPVVFFEDLFDIGTTGKRYSHLPDNATDLPVRLDIVNIILAHQKLQFKNGDYAVPTSLTGGQAPYYQQGGSGDHVVMERSGKAIIGVTDKYNTTSNNSQDEEVWVSVADPTWRDIDLYDYSGAHGVTPTHVYNDGRVLIKTAPVGHTISGARGHGYSIWAPKPAGVTFSTVTDMYNYLATYAPSRATSTVQEWEMADDLGDSHLQSLKQGGRLPDYSTAQRTVGRIYADAGKNITYKVFPEVNGRTQNIALYNTSGTMVSDVTGTSSSGSPLTGSYTPGSSGWYTIKVKNSTTSDAGQRVWVNVTYTAPTTVNTRTSPGNLRTIGAIQDPVDVNEPYLTKVVLQAYPNPSKGAVRLVFHNVDHKEIVTVKLFSVDGTQMFSVKGTPTAVQNNFNKNYTSLSAGLYFLEASAPGLKERVKLVKM